MGWNNARMTAEFKKKENQVMMICRNSGMSDEACERLYDADLKAFNKDRTFYERTQALEIAEEGFTESDNDDPYIDRFPESFTVWQKPDEDIPFWWMDEIENKSLYLAIQGMSVKRKLLLQYLVYEGRSQTETAQLMGISQQTVQEHFRAIQKILKESFAE